MENFARTAEAIAARPGKLDKVAALAGYLQGLADDDLVAAVRFFAGRPFAARDDRTLSLGGGTVVGVARRLWGFDDAALTEAYRATGDLGVNIASLYRLPERCEEIDRATETSPLHRQQHSTQIRNKLLSEIAELKVDLSKALQQNLRPARALEKYDPDLGPPKPIDLAEKRRKRRQA
jgi:hypothetical protein